MNNAMGRQLRYLAIFLFFITSCGNQEKASAPVKMTPAGARVDLDRVSLEVRDSTIISQDDENYILRFRYTVNNQAGAIISFPCLYPRIDDLIEVNLTNIENKVLMLGRRPLEGLTLAEPEALKIPLKKTNLTFEAPILASQLNSADPIEMRVRLHAPSRYDELRSSIEAPKKILIWPKKLQD